MRIEKLRTVTVEVPGQDGPIKDDASSIGCLLVFLDTDDGLTGESLLFAFDPRHLGVVDRMLETLEGDVIGEDPEYVERIGQKLWARTRFFGHEGVTAFARSAIDRACWDLISQAAGRPLYRILGGTRDDVPAYASGLWLSLTPDQLAVEARRFVDAGFRAIKMRIGKPRIEDDVERVRLVREAIGSDIALMVDANKRFTVEHAIRLGRRLEVFGLAWFEEPVAAQDLTGSAEIAAALDTPIASGESVFTRYGFRTMLELRAADILMPDFGRVGGLTEMLKVAHMAEAFDVPVTPHNYPHESIQILGSIPNGTYLECLPWFSPLYRESIEVVNGRVTIPTAAGGYRLDPDAIERFRLR